MSGVREEELEYESDPEEAKLLLKMRRREASDDEDGEDDNVEERDLPSKAVIVSDYESDAQGAAADYDEDESDIDQVSVEEELEIDHEDELTEHDGGYAVRLSSGEVIAEEFDGRRLVGNLKSAEEKKAGNEGELYDNDDQPPIDQSGMEGEKKENEPFAVPTAGAFYMHDDRFRDSAGGRHRRTLGGKKLWESKDNRKWGHDKFEEITMEETNYDKGRKGPRGRYRGRGKIRDENRGYPQGNKSSNAYNNNNQNNAAPKGVRGRGPRKYQPSSQNYREVSTQNRQPGNSAAKSSYASSERASVAASSKDQYDPVSLRKHVVASSLNSASPPFYPSGSSSKEEVPLNQVGRVTPSTQHQNNLESPPVQSRFQPSQVSRSQAFSPPRAALSVSSIDSGEVESLPRTGLVGEGKDNSVQSSDGRNGFPYGGGQVISNGGDRNFPGTPAFLPVMQFGGQHPGGMGVPAVGMAFPGYVAQPQLGMGKSEMTWLPVLASAAGAMGAPYCSPYLTVDGAAYQNTSGQTSTLATISSKENIASKPANELKPSQRLEIANDEFGQRQSKPRRYTEMKFDQ